jgi:hypothetical protein
MPGDVECRPGNEAAATDEDGRGNGNYRAGLDRRERTTVGRTAPLAVINQDAADPRDAPVSHPAHPAQP